MPTPREQLSVRLPGDLCAMLRDRAEEMDTSVTAAIEDAVRRWLGLSGLLNRTADYDPTNDEGSLDAINERLSRLERMAENSGAM